MAIVHGGRLVAQALKRQGTTHLFTLCGGHIQAIYDGCVDEGIRVVDVRHEQTAGHAADGYARVTGRPGVCAVTAGPGVTDVVTAVANAHRAGVPMVVIGGAGPRLLTDMGSLQDMDAVTLMRPITKWSVQVPETRRILEYVDAAFRVAQANLPGPVFLEMPLDLLMNMHDDADLPATRPLAEAPRPAGDPRAVAKAVDLLRGAQRPCFLIGSQIRWSPLGRPELLGGPTSSEARNAPVLPAPALTSSEARNAPVLPAPAPTSGAAASAPMPAAPHGNAVKRAADAFEVPFYLNGMARGALPCDHPGLFSRSRRFALAQADVAFVFGTPFDFRVDYGRSPTWAENVKIVQVDLDGAELGRNRRVEVPIHGDSGLVLQELVSAVGSKRTPPWLAAVRADETKRRAKMAAEIESNDSPPNPLRVCAEVGRRLGKNDIVIGDGGDFVATAAYVLKLEWPQLWIDPGPLGTLGVGPGYAMAAKLLRPEANVVMVYGDGSFGLHALEFEAMARQDIPVIAVIGNDAGWTQIRRGQVELYGEARAVATALDYTRYDKVVEAVGGFGAWVERAEDLGPALDRAFASKKPACVNVKVAKSDFRKGAISV